jgi:hypothetical protein
LDARESGGNAQEAAAKKMAVGLLIDEY